MDINKVCPNKVDEARIEKLFDSLWDDLSAKIDAIPPSEVTGNVARKESDILEEVVTGIRSIEGRFREFSSDALERPYRTLRRSRRFHPMMIVEMADEFSEKSGDPMFLIMLAGIFRDEFPWFSEILMETYRDIRTGSTSKVEDAIQRLRRLLKSIGRGHPMFRELMGDSKEGFMILMELPVLIERTLDRASGGLFRPEEVDPLA